MTSVGVRAISCTSRALWSCSCPPVSGCPDRSPSASSAVDLDEYPDVTLAFTHPLRLSSTMDSLISELCDEIFADLQQVNGNFN